MPKVTIAIPTYNRKEYLKECLESILNQTFQDFLIYVFDNCSDYDVEGFLKEFNDNRIVLLRSDKNIGNIENFGRIFTYKFPSKYLIIFHDDDVMHPLLLEKEVNILNKHEDIVFVATSLKFVKNYKKMFDFSVVKNRQNFYICKKPTDLIRLILKDFDLCYDSVMYRTNIVEDNRPFDKEFSKWTDRPYLIELARNGNVGIVKEKLVNYRIHRKQDSQDCSINEMKYAFRLFSFYKENLAKPLSKEDKKLFYSFSTNNLILAGFSFSKDFKEYLIFIREAKEKGFFHLKYLNLKGVYYFLKGLKNLYFLK